MRKVFKYLSYAVVYLIISIASAYGVITLSTSYAGRQARGNGSDESSTLPSQLTSIIENFSNSSYLSFNLNTNIDYQDESFEITVDGELDMSKGFENISFGGNVNALIVNSDISYDMNFIYNNGKTYVDILNGKMTIETTSVFNSITQILNLLDVKIPELGFDMSSFDISSMMGIFSNLEENVLKNGNYEIKIALPTEKYLILICDKDYKVLSLNFDYATEEFSVAVNGNLNYPTTSSIPTPNDEEYINVGNLLDVTESAIRYAKDLTNPAYEINLDYNDMSVKGQLFVNPNAQTAMFTMIIDENTLNLIYLNNCIFVEYGEVYVKFELKDIDKVDELLNNQLNVKLPIEEITNLIDDLKNGKFLDSISGVDFSTLLNKDLNSIDLSVIEKVYVEGDKTFIDIKNIGQVGLGQNNKILNFISFSNNEVKLSLKVIDFKDFSLIASTDSYINLVVMLPTINNALDILKSTTIRGSIAVKYGEFSLPVEFIAVTSNDYYKLATTIEDKDFTIEKLNNKIYLNLAETFKCVVNLDTFSDELIKFISEINYDLHLKEISEIIDKFESIISSEQNLALIKSLTQTENGFVITLSNDMVITLGNDEKTILVDTSVNGVEISVNVNGTDEILTIPTFNDEEYDKVETLLELVKVIVNSGIIEAIEGGVNYFKNGKAGFEFSTTYSGVTVNGTLYADILAKTLTLNANFKGETISLKLLTGVVYLEYNNIFAKFELNDLTLLADFLNKNFALNIPVEKLSALFNAVNSGDIESAFNMISDKLPKEFKLDLDTIDKTFFENITKEGNDLIIPVGDNLVTITTINKLLTAIKFNGYGVDLTAKTVDYKETNLVSSKESYINLVIFLDTIENAINIANSNTISGQIELGFSEYKITLDYVVSKADTLYAEISTIVKDMNIKISYLNGKVYLNVDGKVMLMSVVNNFPIAVKDFLIGIGIETDNAEVIEKVISSLTEVVNPEINPALIKSLTQTENGFVITLSNDMVITLGNDEKTILVDTSVNGVEISVNVNGTDEILTIPTFNDEEYDKVETLLELVKVIVNSGIIEAIEGGANYFKDGKAGFEFNVSYSGVAVNGTLYADILAKTLTLNANFKGETISLKLLTGVVYLEYNNIFATFKLNDLTLLADFLNKNFALNIPVEKLSALFNAVNSGDIESAFNMISDKLPKEFKLDLDTIDKTFFENITKEGNDLIIPVGDNLVTITTINKLLTAIKFNGYGVDLTAKTTIYKETSLASSESGYINLVDLLPTIENALQIFRASTISGNINIKLNELEIPMTFNYTNIDGVYAEFKTSIYNGKIEIHYIGNVIYINLLDQIKLYSDLENLPNALKELTDGLDTLINPILDMVGITSEFINSLKNHDTSALKLAVKQVENNLIITINGTDISLTNGSNELLISSIIKNTTIDARIAENVDGITKDNIDVNEYVPIEQIFRLFNAAKNMSKREDFHVTGYIDLKLGNWSLAGIQFNVYIKVVDKKLQMIIEFPSIPSFPLVISNAGSLTIYYKDCDVYLHRTETVKKKTHVETVKLTTNSLFENILDYVQFGFGFSDLAMSLMQIDMGKYRQGETIDLSNVLSGFAVKELGNQTEYDMTFNLGEIVDNKALSNLSLRTYIGENEMGESYLQELALSTKIADMITISTPVNKDGSDDKEKIIKIVDYGKSIDDKIQELYDYENNYNFPYDTIMEKTGDGDWTIASEVLRTITFVTNSSTSLPNLSGVYNSDITLPSLEMIVVDDDITRSTKTFEGWYTTENFDSDTLFESTKMPKHDTTLYAKWNEEILRYSTITFVTNSDINVDSIRLLEGSQFNLPTLSLKQIIAEDGKTVSSYSFAGWSTNEDGNVNFTSSVMPHDDTTLYAIWKLEKVEECSEFKLYDNGELLYSIYLPAGEAIDLTGISKVNESSKFYLDENYVDEFTENLIMPNKNLTLHLRNKYTLIISSEYGNIANTTMEVWQGENINVANQNSYYLDFNSNGNVVEENVMGKHHRTYYNFLGYKINDNEITNDYSIILTNMPNGNYTVESIWETNDVVYYTVNFHADWYKPYGYIDPKVKTEPPKNIPSIEVLDGTTITLEKYIFTCEARPTAISRYKTLYSTTWGTSAWANNTQKRKGQRSFTITQNTDLYACWDDAPTASDLENYNLYKDMNSNIA